MAHWRIRDLAGMAAGVPLAMPVAVGSLARHSRLFHPRGIVLAGACEPAGMSPWQELGQMLAGPVLVRFSGAWWKKREWPDVLGCAIRFRDIASADPADPEARSGDQDLLLATIRSPVTIFISTVFTDPRGFVDNRYFGVAPFVAPAVGRIKLRVTPSIATSEAPTREEKLRDALERQAITLVLEARPAKFGSIYRHFATIVLDREVAIDQRKLKFDPFRCGKGLEPVGFLQHLRMATYRVGQRARPG